MEKGKEKTFYLEKGLNVEVYDALHAAVPVSLEGDMDFYIRQASITGSPVLELGCGTGRVSLPLAEAGFTVVGLDISPAMLELAERKRSSYSSDIQKRISFVKGNMVDFDLSQSFNLIIIPFRAWQSLITPDDQRRSLLTMRRHLTDKGLLIIDIFDPRLDMCIPGEQDRSKHNPVVKNIFTGNDVEIQIAKHFNDTLNQVLIETWRFIERNSSGEVVRMDEEILRLRWTYRWEMRYLLELTGFEIINEFSNYDCSEPSYGKEQIWVVRKTGD